MVAALGLPCVAGEPRQERPDGGDPAPVGGKPAQPGPAEEAKRREAEAEVRLKAEVAALVKNLADEQWSVRDAAQKRLEEIGAPAVPALKEAAASQDLEVSTRARALLRRLVGQGWLGVEIHDPDGTEREIRELPERSGVIVGRTLEGTPAAKAGLTAGDLVYSADGTVLKDCRHMIETVSKIEPGTKVRLIIYRDAKKQEVEVTVARRPPQYALAGEEVEDPPEEPPGIEFAPIE